MGQMLDFFVRHLVSPRDIKPRNQIQFGQRRQSRIGDRAGYCCRPSLWCKRRFRPQKYRPGNAHHTDLFFELGPTFEPVLASQDKLGIGQTGGAATYSEKLLERDGCARVILLQKLLRLLLQLFKGGRAGNFGVPDIQSPSNVPGSAFEYLMRS